MLQDAGRVRKLKWLCRRGMKELDVLLERFIAENTQLLSSGEWPLLEGLLQCEDDQLWDWVQNPRNADASVYRELLQIIVDGTPRTT